MNLEHLENLSLPPIQIVEKVLAEKSLIDFTELFFQVLEPGRKWINNWHTDAIADHLSACVPKPVYKLDENDNYLLDKDDNRIIEYFTKADIQRLVINIPPGCTKSLLLCVLFPSWVWGPRNFPQLRFLFTSYAENLSVRDSVNCRIIIESKLYQEYWGHNFRLREDQNQKIRYSTDKGGFRIASSLDGMATGERVDILGIDDPINLKDTLKPLQTKVVRANETYDTALSSRYMPETGSGIVCMQRCAVNDMAGHVLAKEMGWEHLCLPMEYTGKNQSKTSLHFIDPRTEENQLLIPKRIDDQQIRVLKKDLGPYGYGAQYQQNPKDKEGKIFDITCFQFVKQLPTNKTLIMAVRYWDKAGTEDGGAWTAGVLMVRYADNTYYVVNTIRGQWEARNREPRIRVAAENDSNLFPRHKYIVYVEQEPGSGGKESAENTIRNLSGYIVRADRVTGAKESRWEPYAIQVSNRNVFIVSGNWTQDFLEEHDNAGVGKYRDQLDAGSGAFNKLALIKIAGVIKHGK